MFQVEDYGPLLGQCIYPFVADESRAAFERLNRNVFEGESGSLEFDVVGLNGRRRRAETSVAPLLSPGGPGQHRPQSPAPQRRLQPKLAFDFAAERPDPHPVVEAFMRHDESQCFARDEVRETVIPAYMGLITQIDTHLGRLFEAMEDPDLRERGTDVKDLGLRVLAYLQDIRAKKTHFPDDTVLVADEVTLDRQRRGLGQQYEVDLAHG